MRKAFTLIELLVVVSIIAILAILAIVYFRSEIFKANDARRKSDLNRIKIAAEEYEKDHNCYPQYIQCGVHANQPVYPYLRDVPCDPVTKASYQYENDGSATCANWYRIYTTLQNTADTSITPGIGPNFAFNFYASSPNAPIPNQGTPPPSNPPSSAPQPSSTPGGGASSGFYGCKSGVCVPISWDASRPGPECDPNYQNSNCYGQCGSQSTECIPWH